MTKLLFFKGQINVKTIYQPQINVMLFNQPMYPMAYQTH